METLGDRRPLASRNSRWAQGLARWLAARAITPNQISQGSMVAAALAGGAFYCAGQAVGGWSALLLIGAALCCQLRLLCNLFDGMVAVEGGKGAADGPLWNEVPDRIADLLILVGVGYGLDLPALGWAGAGFAILTAYVRELGRANGLPADFSGPMAKQHRMAAITLGAVLSAVEVLWWGHVYVLTVALWLVVVGAAVTAVSRGRNVVLALRLRG